MAASTSPRSASGRRSTVDPVSIAVMPSLRGSRRPHRLPRGRGAAAETTPDSSPIITLRATWATCPAVNPNASNSWRRRRRGAEPVERDDGALRADPAVPAQGDAGLDADALGVAGRQDRVAVGLGLGAEPVPGGQRDDPRPDALRGQLRARRHRQVQLRAGRDEDHVRVGRVAFAVDGLREDVAAQLDALDRVRRGPVEDGQLLAGEREGDRAVRARDRRGATRRPPRWGRRGG